MMSSNELGRVSTLKIVGSKETDSLIVVGIKEGASEGIEGRRVSTGIVKAGTMGLHPQAAPKKF